MNSNVILLYDDDCGICTKYTKMISRLRPSLPILPMHHEKLVAIGIRKIGENAYWKSFHIVQNGVWTTESDAITALTTTFPFGKFLGLLTTVEPVKYSLLKLLNIMQRIRKQECSVN